MSFDKDAKAEMEGIPIPHVSVETTVRKKKKSAGQWKCLIRVNLTANDEGIVYLRGTVAKNEVTGEIPPLFDSNENFEMEVPFPIGMKKLVEDMLKGEELSTQQFVEDEDYLRTEDSLVKGVLNSMSASLKKAHGMELDADSHVATRGSFVPRSLRPKKGEDLHQHIIGHFEKKGSEIVVPDHLITPATSYYVPDKGIIARLKQHLYSGVPAICLIGPTGSGKTLLSYHLASELNKFGYGSLVIDASERLSGDRLFDRDDISGDETKILEGVLIRAARETKEKGLRLLVVINEFNSFSDASRREFYRLFDPHNRFYQIQSSKISPAEAMVDFSHVQFILSANPLSDRYITEDARKLTNAELRRTLVWYMDYETSPERLNPILTAIIQNFGTYQLVKNAVPDLEMSSNFTHAIETASRIFCELVKPAEDGTRLGHDVSPQDVAHMAWSVIIDPDPATSWIHAILSNILYKIWDIDIRMVAAERIRQATGIAVPEELVTKGA